MQIIDRIMYMYLKKIISLAFCTVLLVELCIAYNSEFIHATLNKKAIVFHYENMWKCVLKNVYIGPVCVEITMS